VEIKTTAQTPNPDLLQKAADFVHAYLLGEGMRPSGRSGPNRENEGSAL
jgi:hypothetical protein